MSKLKDKPGENSDKPQESNHRIRDGVECLLKFAVSDADKNVSADKPGLIEKISPILQKAPNQLNAADMTALYIAYNELSQLVAPATFESLWLKELAEKEDRKDIQSANKKIRYEFSYWMFVWILIIVGVSTYFAQSYVSFISDTLETVKELETSLQGIEDKISAAKVAHESKDDDLDEIDPIKNLLIQKQVIWLELNSHYHELKIGFLRWKFCLFTDSQGCIQNVATQAADTLPPVEITAQTQACQVKFATNLKTCGPELTPVAPDLKARETKCKNKTPGKKTEICLHAAKTDYDREVKNKDALQDQRQQCLAGFQADKTRCETNLIQLQQKQRLKAELVKKEIHEKAERDSFFSDAKANLRNLNFLLLPTLLGALGALAYVIRQILQSFKQSSFRVNSKRSWVMRVALGSALGLISGIVISPELKYFESAKFSPLVWGFLMGYSIEFAFSLFDSLIKKGRDALAAVTPAAANPAAPSLPDDTPPAKDPNVKKDESHIDGCDVAINEQDITLDEQLPAAEGGVN